LLLRDGMAQMFGPSGQVLAELAKANQQQPQQTQQTKQAQLPADAQTRIEADAATDVQEQA